MKWVPIEPSPNSVNPSFFFAYFYRRLFRSCGFQEGRIADKASFSGKILPRKGVEIFPETLVALNLTFQDTSLPLPQDTYRTGVLEILSEGSRFGLPSYRLAPLRKSSFPCQGATRKWFMAAYCQDNGNTKKDWTPICLYAMRTYSLSVIHRRMPIGTKMHYHQCVCPRLIYQKMGICLQKHTKKGWLCK